MNAQHTTPGRFRRVLRAAISDAFGACRRRGLGRLGRADAGLVLDHVVAALALDVRVTPVEPEVRERAERIPDWEQDVQSVLKSVRTPLAEDRPARERVRARERKKKRAVRRRTPNTACSVCGAPLYRAPAEFKWQARACSRACLGTLRSARLKRGDRGLISGTRPAPEGAR